MVPLVGVGVEVGLCAGVGGWGGQRNLSNKRPQNRQWREEGSVYVYGCGVVSGESNQT